MEGVVEPGGFGDDLERLAGGNEDLGPLQSQPQQTLQRGFAGLLPDAVREKRDRDA
jgi:hypothetical protein